MKLVITITTNNHHDNDAIVTIVVIAVIVVLVIVNVGRSTLCTRSQEVGEPGGRPEIYVCNRYVYVYVYIIYIERDTYTYIYIYIYLFMYGSRAGAPSTRPTPREVHVLTPSRLCFHHLCLPFRPLPCLTWPTTCGKSSGLNDPTVPRLPPPFCPFRSRTQPCKRA